MLRQVVNKHYKPRLIPFQVTTTAAAATVNIGYGDYTASRTDVGAANLIHRHGFYRDSLLFVTQSVVNGGYACESSGALEKDLFAFQLFSASGAQNEGSCEGFCFGWDSPDINFCLPQRVACTTDYPQIIWGKVTGATGAVAIGGRDFGCSRTAAGTYTITFKREFGRIPVVMASGIATAAATTPKLASKTAAGVQVVMAPQTGTPTDADFYICAVGPRSSSDSARGRMPLENTQRHPRIVAGSITNSGGTWSLGVGGATGGIDFTNLADNGTGDFSVTLANNFKREPACFVTTTAERSQIGSFTSATGILRVQTRDLNGSLVDTSGITNILLIGSDDASEY